MDLKIALAQENAVVRFHAGWANFAEWLDETVGGKQLVTARQSKRLFIEHFSRRLLVAHGKSDGFICEANIDADRLASYVRDEVGKDGGPTGMAMEHACMDCTHQKRYRSDLIDEGLELEGAGQGLVAGIEDETGDANHPLNNLVSGHLIKHQLIL